MVAGDSNYLTVDTHLAARPPSSQTSWTISREVERAWTKGFVRGDSWEWNCFMTGFGNELDKR